MGLPLLAHDSVVESDWATLVGRAAQGDRVALRTVLRAIAPAMLEAARRILGPDAAELDDVVQDSLVAVTSALSRLHEPQALRGFATTTAMRRALRARDRWRRTGGDQPVPDVVGRDDPSAVVAAKQRAELLLDLLHELPERQRDALALRYCLGHTLEEVATMTQTPVNTVRSRIRLGRQALRTKLDKRSSLRAELTGPTDPTGGGAR